MAAGGVLTALDVVESHANRLVVDVTCNAGRHGACATDHRRRSTRWTSVHVRKVSDRTFLLHLGGKLEVTPKVPLKNRDDLSRAYTPGVARVCLAIAENPSDARRLTIKRNTVAVVTDGSAVLGLGNIGAGGRAAGDGGQGRPLQAVRRRRRLAGVPRHPGRRGDHHDRQGDRPGVRRDQPRGHRGTALLRDRAAASRAARHPGVPRRPARHGDRRARGAHERDAGCRQVAQRTCGSSSAASAPPGTPSYGC